MLASRDGERRGCLGSESRAQLANLTASDGLAADELGYTVAASGNTVVVGAPYAAEGGNYAQGAAYVFGP